VPFFKSLRGKYLIYIYMYLNFGESEIEINGAIYHAENYNCFKVIFMLFFMICTFYLVYTYIL